MRLVHLYNELVLSQGAEMRSLDSLACLFLPALSELGWGVVVVCVVRVSLLLASAAAHVLVILYLHGGCGLFCACVVVAG